MAYDSLSLSQPLHGGGYNEYLLNKMQNKDNPQSAIQQVKQNFSQQSLMDTVSGFASELRSQNLVKAVAAFQEGNTGLPPTLTERGAKSIRTEQSPCKPLLKPRRKQYGVWRLNSIPP